MTLKMLSKYYELRKKLTLYEDTLGSLRAAAESTTTTLSDMPRAHGSQDKISRFASQILDMEAQIADLRHAAAHERETIAIFVGGIDDGYIRTIYSLRFVECMTWPKVAEAVGGGNTQESVKMACYRYLKTIE